MKRSILLLALLGLTIGNVSAQLTSGIRDVKIKEGSRSLTITWNSLLPGDSVARVGGLTLSDDAATTRHSLTAGNLTPDTEYAISLFSTNQAADIHRTSARTRQANAGLIERYGVPFVEALAANFGPIDEEALAPEVSRTIAIHELIGARRNLAAANQQLAECEANLAKMKAVKDGFDDPNAKDLPADLQAETNDILALAPELTADDLTALLRVKVAEQLKLLTAMREEIQRQRAEIKTQADALAQVVTAGK